VHKSIVKRHNLLRVIQMVYSGLFAIYKNQRLFSKSVYMKILMADWELSKLRASIGKRGKDA